MSLIGEDISLEIQIGTQAAGGGEITWGTAASIEGIANKLEITETVEIIATRAFGDARKKKRATAGETMISIDHLVGITGWHYYSSGTLIGRPVKVSVKELTSLSTAKSWEGVIQQWKWTANNGEAQAESIQIECDVDES